MRQLCSLARLSVDRLSLPSKDCSERIGGDKVGASERDGVGVVGVERRIGGVGWRVNESESRM